MKNLVKLNYLLFLFITLFFTACSNKSYEFQVSNIDYSSKYANDNFMNQHKQTQKLLKQYFKPWSQKEVTYNLIEAAWGLNYRFKTIYLENHKIAKASWFDKQKENFNLEKYNTLLKKAITLKNTDVRVLPTSSPMFYEPSIPGEGFPFDYNQNSRLKINTPIFVSHLSKDKAWAYIQASSFGGWVKIQDIAFVNEQFIKEFQTSNYYVAVKEKFSLYDNIFRDYIKVGTIFPKKENKYLIARADYNQNAIISYINIKQNEVDKLPIKYNTLNRIKIAKELLNEPYGWGGMLNNRDCSSFTKDFFTPFGKYLNRNSKGQIKNGKYIEISHFTKKQKKQFLMEKGVPFSTLVYLKGHIMLYVGVKNNEPLVMHNIWSVKLKDKKGNEYRHIIGKATITSLEPGKNLKDFDEENNIINKILGIVIL